MTAFILLPLMPDGLAGKWDGLEADVVVRRTISAEPAVVFRAVSDLDTWRRILPEDCADDWALVEPSRGEGARGTVRYSFAGMHRRLDLTISETEEPRLVDYEHPGNKGFTTRWSLRQGTDGTDVELRTFLYPPGWPLKGYFFKRVQPAWTDCYERALDALEAEL